MYWRSGCCLSRRSHRSTSLRCGQREPAGSQSRDDGVWRGDTARASVRQDCRRQRDDFVQPVGLDVGGPAVRARSRHQRGRARCPGFHQRRSRPAAAGSAGQSDLSQGEPRRRARDDPVDDVRHGTARTHVRLRLVGRRAATVPGRGRRAGQRGRRCAPGGEGRAQSSHAGEVRPGVRPGPKRARRRQCEPAKGSGLQRDDNVRDRCDGSTPQGGGLRAVDRRVSQWCAHTPRRPGRRPGLGPGHPGGRPHEWQTGGPAAGVPADGCEHHRHG